MYLFFPFVWVYFGVVTLYISLLIRPTCYLDIHYLNLMAGGVWPGGAKEVNKTRMIKTAREAIVCHVGTESNSVARI